MRGIASILVLVFVGCGSTGVIKVGTHDRAARDSNCQLDVFTTRDDVGQDFEAICLISSESGSTLFNDRSTEGRMQEVKRKACARGADAIIVTSMGRTANRVGQGYSQAMISVEAIAYADSSD